jgi:hypothetical protein
MLLHELDGGQVAQAHMRSHGVEVLAPRLDHDLRLATRAEPLEGQALIAQLPVERLVGAVLPGLARIDQGGLDLSLGEPLQDSVADELRATVGAQVHRRVVDADQSCQDFDDAPRADAAGDVDGQALVG